MAVAAAEEVFRRDDSDPDVVGRHDAVGATFQFGIERKSDHPDPRPAQLFHLVTGIGQITVSTPAADVIFEIEHLRHLQPPPVVAGVVGDAAQLLVQIEVLCKQNCFFRFFHGLNISLSGKVFKCFMHDFIRIINDFGIVKCRFPGYSVCVSTETATTDSNGKEKTGGGE